MDSAMAKKKKDAAPTQYGLAAVVAKHVELANVYLGSMSARLLAPHKTVTEAMVKDEVEAKLAWSPSFHVQEVPSALVIRIPFKVMLARRDGKAEPLAEIQVEFTLEYPLDLLPPSEMRPALFDAFSKVNGVYNSWPYLREVVQNTFARMALPPVVLPVYRVPKPKESAPAVTGDDEKPKK